MREKSREREGEGGRRGGKSDLPAKLCVNSAQRAPESVRGPEGKITGRRSPVINCFSARLVESLWPW